MSVPTTVAARDASSDVSRSPFFDLLGGGESRKKTVGDDRYRAYAISPLRHFVCVCV